MARDFTINNLQNYTYTEKRGYPVGEQSPYPSIWTLYSSSNGIYAGGRFEGYFNRIARWDGQKWNKVGDGINIWDGWSDLDRRFCTVNDITEYKGDIYAGCRFDFLNLDETAKVVVFKFDGDKFIPLRWDGIIPSPTYNTSYTYGLLSNDKYLYICGRYETNPSLEENASLLRWDGESFTRLDDGNFYEAYAAVSDSSGLYVSGVPKPGYNRIRKYDGISWTDVTAFPETSGWITSLRFISGELYAANRGGGIYKLDRDDNTWYRLGNLTYVADFISSNGQIYAVGSFNNENGKYVSRWDGHSWNSLDFPFDSSNPNLVTIISSSDGIYVGGLVWSKGYDGTYSPKMSSISRWDGSNWNPLGEYISAAYPIAEDITSIIGMASGSEGLYVSGFINGGVKLWNGETYSNLSGGIRQWHFTTVISGSDGVYLNTFSGSDVDYIAMCKWDGSGWTNISYESGEGRYTVSTMITSSQGIYALSEGKLFLYNGTNCNLITDGIEGIYDDAAIRSGSDGLYFCNGSNIQKWDGATKTNISLPYGFVRSRPHHGIEIDSNNNIYTIVANNEIDNQQALYKYNGSWEKVKDLPLENYVLGTNYYYLVGSGSAGLYISRWNQGQFNGFVPDPNRCNLYLYDGSNMHKIIDSNGLIETVLESPEGLYACGWFTRQGYKLMLIKDWSSEQIKPLIYGTNTVISMRKPSPYSVIIE